MRDDARDATQLLLDHLKGEDPSTRELVAVTYEELRRRARRVLRSSRGPRVLAPTELVHEAFLRIIDRSSIDWAGKTHFLAVASTTLQRVLVDAIRARSALKRGGRQEQVPLAGLELADPLGCQDAEPFLSALERLEGLSPRQAEVIRLRYLGGLSVAEVAMVIGMSERTVKADARMARAWLSRELDQA